MHFEIDDALARLRREGYYVSRLSVSDDAAVGYLLDLGQSLGELYVFTGLRCIEPVIRTTPTRSKRAAPFDRSESIGWHGDFATHEERPHLSLSYITRGDPQGAGTMEPGGFARLRESWIWSCSKSRKGLAALQLLSEERLPSATRMVARSAGFQ